MCHLVTYFEPTRDSGLNIMQSKEFPSADLATSEAEILVMANCKDVRVWNLVGKAQLVHTIQWSLPDAE